MSNGWTPERRQRQSEMIKQWKPWERSTGPKTKAGKLKTCQNATRSIQVEQCLQKIASLLTDQKKFQVEVAKSYLTT
jgi:hypothetical protein